MFEINGKIAGKFYPNIFTLHYYVYIFYDGLNICFFRFFFGKNKVMAYALGKSAQEEIHNNLHKLAMKIEGQCGLLFTNRPVDNVIE